MARIAPSTCGRGGRSFATSAAAETRRLTVKVFSRGINGPPVPLDDFQFIVNENNVGDPQVGVPEDQVDESKIPSLKPPASHSPVVAAGDSGNPTVYVPPGSYLVSVKAPGHKMGGNWVTVDGGEAEVAVELLPDPLPLSKIRVFVFHDNQPVNGEPDLPSEAGLEGFRIVVADAAGELTVDYFGNPLGTQYEKDAEGNFIFDANGNPIPIPGTGDIKILTDKNGYAVVENIPPGKYGVQAIPPDGTDWVQTTTIEGTRVIDVWVEEGNDGYSSEYLYRFPVVWFGFVRPMEFPAPSPGEARGTIRGLVRTVFEYDTPGVPIAFGPPVERPWIALTDIGGNDQQVYLGRGEADGSFLIKNVPPGLYQMAVWDEYLDYIISFRTVQLPGKNGSLDVVVEDDPVNYPGQIGIPRWYGWIKGKVFIDSNENGIFEPGEEGVAGVQVVTRFKDGTIQYATVTDLEGNYSFDEVFELEHFTVAGAGFTRLDRTGVSANPDQRYPVPEVFDGALTAAVLTWAGGTNYLDFGKRPYRRGENGGISGIVHYATMRNETDPRLAAAEDFEPGIPNVTVNLYQKNSDGTLVLINTVKTDAWEHPAGCVPPHAPPDPRCIEKPSLGDQIRPGVFDGGYAFKEKWVLDGSNVPVRDPDTGEYLKEPLPVGTYYVEAVPPADPNNPLPDGSPRPLYRVVAEESVNTDQGDPYVINTLPRQQDGVPPCPERKPAKENRAWIPAPPCAGEPHLVQDPRSPYYGQYRPLCNIKEVTLGDGENATANFFLYTDVPVPGRILGLLVDDVNIETDPSLIYYGGKRGIPYTPIGIRDYTGKLITTVHSDKNGIFEVLLPSTYTTNVPTPSGIVPYMYRVVGNDPGDPDKPNLNYNPNYQTLSLVFDVWPGKTTYADVALFPITAFVATSQSQFSRPPQCAVPRGTPQLFKVDRVVVTEGEEIVLTGLDFGAAQGEGKVTLDGDHRHVQVLAWSDKSITIKVLPSFSSGRGGTAQLLVTNDNGKVTPTGITIHVLGGDYHPAVLHVKKDGTGDYTTIQEAINVAAGETLIVVHPGIYYENPILYTRAAGDPVIKKVRLQGLGPGGINPVGPGGNPVTITGSTIDGRFFLTDPAAWRNLLNTLDYDYIDAPDLYEGQVITVLAKDGDFNREFNSRIDGFTITGARGNGAGGIYVNAYCRYLEISNNVIQSNAGGFGGGITIGKPYAGSSHNENIRIHHNRILNNGGLNLAGGIGIFNGADNYTVDHNVICGNYSAEYGGGISHYGLSPNGSIHHNCILFNASFDEGAGILVGGELPKPPAELSPGSGNVSIYNNLIQGNLANDDGGGIRLLQPTTYEIKIYNNMIVNNVSTDLGGGIALDDASEVIIYNNTIAKNISTATAEDSDRLPHGAGLVSEVNSTAFQAVLPPDAPNFSNPVLFNNIFWDNRAYYFDLNARQLADGGVIDLEVFGTPGTFSPYCCSLTRAYPGGSNNLTGNPAFVREYDTSVKAAVFAAQPDFKNIKIAVDVPELMGDYHLAAGSPVIGRGAQSFGGYGAPADDFDGDARGVIIDIGADQYQG